MYLKIMGPDDAPDSDPRKTYRMHEVQDVEFYRDDDGGAFAWFTTAEGGGIEVPIIGNAYLMNEDGKTVASFGSAKLSGNECAPGMPEVA